MNLKFDSPELYINIGHKYDGLLLMVLVYPAGQVDVLYEDETIWRTYRGNQDEASMIRNVYKQKPGFYLLEKFA